MEHPILRPGRYPWWRPEAERLHRELVIGIRSQVEIEMIYHTCGENLTPLNVGQNPHNLWIEALNNLAPAGLIDQLCTQVGTRQLPNLRDAIHAVRAATPRVTARVISDSVLMLDRNPLRAQLVRLAADTTTERVLLVRGASKSGKTWGRYLFEAAANDHGSATVYLSAGTVGSVSEIVDTLFSALNATDRIPPCDGTDDAWYRSVCRRLREQAENRNRVLWIAMDDLGSGPDGKTPLLDDSIRQFWNQFALMLLDPMFRQWFRLMLIHYPDGAVPTKWEHELWREDRPSEADVQRDDVVAALRERLADRRMPEQRLLELADQVIATAEKPEPDGQKPDGPEPEPRLRRIHNALLEILRTQELDQP